MLNSESKQGDKLPTWLTEYPVTLTQILFYLYHNVPDFMPVFMTEEVITALVGTMFPTVTESPSTAASPEDSSQNSPAHEGAAAEKGRNRFDYKLQLNAIFAPKFKLVLLGSSVREPRTGS